jgi:hypothetical protein
MNRTWNRGVSVLAILAASGTGVLGIDAASASVGPRTGVQAQVVDARTSNAVTPLAIVGGGAVKSVRVESARLSQHAARAKARHRTPRQIGRSMAAKRGWGYRQFGCLDSLWTHESSWSIHAKNRSGAYGIPQALPGRKMASAGSNWKHSAYTQIRWGLSYIAQRHGTPCSALAHWRKHHWY